MSIHAIERALFEIAASPVSIARYKEDPDATLGSYRLTEEEISLVKEMDVREIVRRGLNPMLAMRSFNAIMGRTQIGEYFRRMREV